MARDISKILDQFAREANRQAATDRRKFEADRRDQKRRDAASQSAKAELMNAQLEEEIACLNGLLATALQTDNYLNLDHLKLQIQIPEFDPGLLGVEEPKPAVSDYKPAPLGFLKGLLPGAKTRHASEMAIARSEYQRAVAAYKESNAIRKLKLQEAQSAHQAMAEATKKRVSEQHDQIERVKAAMQSGDPDVIASYFDSALERSSYPDSFPSRRRIAYVPESKQLVIELDLPNLDVVPKVKEFKYVKTKNLISEVMRSASDRKRIYSSVVCQIAIRTLHEVFETDRLTNVETVVLNGHVSSVDAATGKDVHPCVISVRATRSTFQDLELSRVDPVACLTALNACISKKPDELVPIRPVLEFDMVDPRFIQEADVLSDLDRRPNLMELTPGEFESLITNLFQRMGLETRQTQASRDGGVDCVAFDPRPIFGGKVVIQAKRYKNTVGVSAVRDLYGTLQNEGASKGILVTTSGFGKASFEFASGKPIELLSGSHLLHLLAEHAGVEAKIVVPNDWKDAVPDT